MIRTREDMKRYALKTCMPMLEAAAERRLSGRPSTVVDTLGYGPTLLEELFRPFWGIAPLLREEEIMLNIRGERVPLGAWLREVLVTGVDPSSPFWWNRFRTAQNGHWFDFQNITELCGLLVGMFFAREQTWDGLRPDEQRAVADYIAEASIGLCEKGAENNHIWFPILCLIVLERFGYSYPGTQALIEAGLKQLEGMYIGGGWYSDGPFGRIDYYEAWSMQAYPLLWCLLADPASHGYAARRARYQERAGAFLRDYIRFFDADGAYPPFGRSLSYRFAAVCVFPLAVLAGVDFDRSLAGEVTRRCVSYFEEHMLMPSGGVLPPGYLYESAALVESYTSSGGAYWAAKTFLCLLIEEKDAFWAAAHLPAETEEYLFSPSDSRLNFVVGHAQNAGVTVYNNHFQYYQFGRYCNPFNDMAGLYDKFAYNSLSGFALSTHDTVSCDNMISLSTGDDAMASHRWGFVDRGRQGDWLISEHMPFSNDAETVIRTMMRPLSGGWHMRVHRVRLSRAYRVCEGGFSLGLWDDYYEVGEKEGGFCVESHELKSFMTTVSSVPFSYAVMKPQPGMHMMAPFALYPAYRTALLEAGEYLFASVFGVHRRGQSGKAPRIRLESGRLWVDDEELPC